MSALVLAVLLASLDQAIVSTALPRIAEDLDGCDGIASVCAAYLLASTAVTPLWGKLGDVFGRKRLYLASTSAFLAASVACGLARNLPELIGARVPQGVGGGGVIVLTLALVGGLVTPRERGRVPGRRNRARRTPTARGARSTRTPSGSGHSEPAPTAESVPAR
ncbi:MFS transporter [Streptomyces sp. NPDC006997]|uniref:MFS transporter n=1 Tax=Streptomyces sp. NPDC006997 TaxID=3155356 RepID=UPI0033E8F6B5